MGEAIGDVLPLAIGVALSPVPIIAIVLMVGTPRARSNGPAFALGWVAGLTVVGGIVLALASGNADDDDGDHPATWFDQFTPGKSLGAGFVLSGINPKNLASSPRSASTS